MRRLLGLLTFPALILAGSANAIDVVTVEGPVQVLESDRSQPDATTYSIVGDDGTRYRIILPESERLRLASILKEYPAAVIRFDGAVVGDTGGPTFNVNRWETVTTTTVDKDGRKIVQRTTRVKR